MGTGRLEEMTKQLGGPLLLWGALQACADAGMSIGQAARSVGCSKANVRYHAHRLNIRFNKHDPGRAWQPEEDELLRALAPNASGIKAVTEPLGRSYYAVKKRAYVLRIHFRRAFPPCSILDSRTPS